MSETTWVTWGSGRVPVGVNESDTNFSTVEKTGGQQSYTISSHNHKLGDEGGAAFQFERPNANTLYMEQRRVADTTSGWKATFRTYLGVNNSSLDSLNNEGQNGMIALLGNTQSSGEQTISNIQPYITCYMWKRTA